MSFEETEFLSAESHKVKSDLVMLLKAINRGWALSEETKLSCVKKLEALMNHQDGRVQTKAIDLLIKLGGMEQATVHLLLKLKAEENRPNITVDLNSLKPEHQKTIEGIVDEQFPKELKGG